MVSISRRERLINNELYESHIELDGKYLIPAKWLYAQGALNNYTFLSDEPRSITEKAAFSLVKDGEQGQIEYHEIPLFIVYDVDSKEWIAYDYDEPEYGHVKLFRNGYPVFAYYSRMYMEEERGGWIHYCDCDDDEEYNNRRIMDLFGKSFGLELKEWTLNS